MSNSERLVRSYRAVKLTAKAVEVLAKHGLKQGSKVALGVIGRATMILSVVDMVVSICDAISSYYRLQQAREETKQLIIEIDTAKEELIVHVKIFKMYSGEQKTKIQNEKQIVEQAMLVKNLIWNSLEIIRKNLDSFRMQPEVVSAIGGNKYNGWCNQYDMAVNQFIELDEEIFGSGAETTEQT